MSVSVDGPPDKRDQESVRSNICLVYRPPLAGSSVDELDTCTSLYFYSSRFCIQALQYTLTGRNWVYLLTKHDS